MGCSLTFSWRQVEEQGDDQVNDTISQSFSCPIPAQDGVTGS